MSGTQRGFKLINDEEVAGPPSQEPDQASKSAQMVMLALRSLSQRALTAITNLFTLCLVASAWFLWARILPDPTDRQLMAVGGYSLFCLMIEMIRRRKP